MESFFYGMLWVRGTLLFIVFKYGPMDPPEMKRSPWIKPTWSHRWEMKGGVLLCMLPCKKAVAIFGWSTDHMRVGQPPPLACGSSPLVGCMVRLSLTYLCGVGSLGGANSWSYGPSNPWAKHQHHTFLWLGVSQNVFGGLPPSLWAQFGVDRPHLGSPNPRVWPLGHTLLHFTSYIVT
jgi:hypothetical protein